MFLSNQPNASNGDFLLKRCVTKSYVYLYVTSFMWQIVSFRIFKFLFLFWKCKFCVELKGLDKIYSVMSSSWSWSFSENDEAAGERLDDVSAISGGRILTFLKYRTVLCVCARLYMNRPPLGVHKQSTPMYEPATASWITSDWQMTAESCLLLRSLHPNHSPTQIAQKITKEWVDKCS